MFPGEEYYSGEEDASQDGQERSRYGGELRKDSDSNEEEESVLVQSVHETVFCDWLPDREDFLGDSKKSTVVGWVFNCPFNHDDFPFTTWVGGMGAAAQDPDNYARYRAVHISLERQAGSAASETEVKHIFK